MYRVEPKTGCKVEKVLPVACAWLVLSKTGPFFRTSLNVKRPCSNIQVRFQQFGNFAANSGKKCPQVCALEGPSLWPWRRSRSVASLSLSLSPFELSSILSSPPSSSCSPGSLRATVPSLPLCSRQAAFSKDPMGTPRSQASLTSFLPFPLSIINTRHEWRAQYKSIHPSPSQGTLLHFSCDTMTLYISPLVEAYTGLGQS